MHGFGTYRFQNGDRYEGNWQEGKRKGQGTKYFANGDKYEGNWEDQ